MRNWKTDNQGDVTRVHRTGHAPIWSLQVTRALPALAGAAQRTRIAHQVRQDVWRACRDVRGFLPVVEVSTSGDETVIRAGGSLTTRSGHVPTLEAKVARVLDDKGNIARWLRHAWRVKH